MRSDLQDNARIAMLAIVALNFPQNMQRCRNRICWAREDSHHRVTDRLYDSAGMLLDGRTEQCKMLTNQRIGIQIAKAFIHGGRTLEVCEQQGHLPEAQSLPLF